MSSIVPFSKTNLIYPKNFFFQEDSNLLCRAFLDKLNVILKGWKISSRFETNKIDAKHWEIKILDPETNLLISHVYEICRFKSFFNTFFDTMQKNNLSCLELLTLRRYSIEDLIQPKIYPEYTFNRNLLNEHFQINDQEVLEKIEKLERDDFLTDNFENVEKLISFNTFINGIFIKIAEKEQNIQYKLQLEMGEDSFKIYYTKIYYTKINNLDYTKHHLYGAKTYSFKFDVLFISDIVIGIKNRFKKMANLLAMHINETFHVSEDLKEVLPLLKKAFASSVSEIEKYSSLDYSNFNIEKFIQNLNCLILNSKIQKYPSIVQYNVNRWDTCYFYIKEEKDTNVFMSISYTDIIKFPDRFIWKLTQNLIRQHLELRSLNVRNLFVNRPPYTNFICYNQEIQPSIFLQNQEQLFSYKFKKEFKDEIVGLSFEEGMSEFSTEINHFFSKEKDLPLKDCIFKFTDTTVKCIIKLKNDQIIVLFNEYICKFKSFNDAIDLFFYELEKYTLRNRDFKIEFKNKLFEQHVSKSRKELDRIISSEPYNGDKELSPFKELKNKGAKAFKRLKRKTPNEKKA